MIKRTALVTFAAILFLAAGLAHADAIGGNWCNPEFGRLEIQGTSIMTPGGNQISNAYDRHASGYIAPAGELNSGADVSMVLMDDDTMHRVVAPGADATIEVWHRCRAQVN